MRIKPSLFSLLFLALALGSAWAKKDLRVVIDARADPEYLAQAEDREYQTYRFAQGKYFSGEKHDPSLSKMEFETIAQSLMLALQKNRFYPTRDPSACDLLIMVSWGTTMLDIDWTETMGITDLGNNDVSAELGGASSGDPAQAAAEADAAAYASEVAQVETFNSGSFHQRRSILQLGYDKAFRSDVSRREQERYMDDLQDERYFIIVTAFDYPHFVKTREFKAVWSTRYSTRNLGTNFRTALDVMNYAASSAFGINLDNLQETEIDPETRAGFGDLEIVEVIGNEDAENANSAAQHGPSQPSP